MGRLLVASLILLSQVVLAQTRERYVVTDYLGSPAQVYSENGLRLEQSAYKPYGDEVQIKDDSAPQYAGYAAAERSFGLVDFGDRHYSPELRRFISPDPIGQLAGGYNHLGQYHYAGNNPLLYVDEEGQYADLVIEVASIGVGLASMASNISDGNYSDAAADAGFALLDGLLMAVPGVPGGTGLLRQGAKQTIERADEVVDVLEATAKNSKHFSDEKQALVDMAKKDKKVGITEEDMQAYKDLNMELTDPFPSNKVRGPEVHPERPHGKEPHGHVGPVDHIPIKDK